MATAQQQTDLKTLVQVIKKAEYIQDGPRTMFLDGLPHAAVGFGALTGYQKDFVGLAEVALKESQGKTEEELAQIETALEEAEATLEALKVAQVDAAKAAELAKEATVAAKADATTAGKLAEKATQTHAKAEKEASSLIKSWAAIKQDRARFAAIIEGSLRMLIEGGWDEEDIMAEAVEAVKAGLTEINADKALCVAVPDALSVKPEARLAFDKIVVDEVSTSLANHLDRLDQKISVSGPQEARHKSEVLGLWAIADCARDDLVSAKRKFDSAEISNFEANALLDLEKEKVAKEEKAISSRMTKRARSQSKIEELEGALGAIERLRTGYPETEVAVAETEEVAAVEQESGAKTEEVGAVEP